MRLYLLTASVQMALKIYSLVTSKYGINEGRQGGSFRENDQGSQEQ